MSLMLHTGSGGTTSNSYSFWSRNDPSTGHTVTNAYNYYAEASIGAGAITNEYGFYAANLLKGTNRWAVYTAGNTPSYFGGNVGIGSTNPANKFEVGGGNIVVTNNTTATATNGAAISIQNGSGGDVVSSWLIPGRRWYAGIDAADSGKFKLAMTVGTPAFGSDTRLTVDNSGSLGIGTTAPSSALQVYGGGSASAITLSRAAAVGTTSIWDYSGGYVKFGSVGNDSLAFLTNNVERVRFDKSGYVGIGTNVPAAALDVSGAILARTNMSSVPQQGAYLMWNLGNGSGETDFVNQRGLGAGGFYFYNADNAGNLGSPIATINSAGTFTSSDLKLKKDLVPIESALAKMLTLQGYTYYWKDQAMRGKDRQVGVVAQEVQKVFPEAIHLDPKSGYLSVAYDHLVGPVIAALREFHEKWQADSEQIHGELGRHTAAIEAIKKSNEQLRAENEELRMLICEDHPKARPCQKAHKAK
jgi:hypothetical protein